METTTIGIDLAKNVFQIHGADQRDKSSWETVPVEIKRSRHEGDELSEAFGQAHHESVAAQVCRL